MRRALVALVFLGSSTLAGNAAADMCPSSDRSIIVVRTVEVDNALRAELIDHLRSALTARGFSVCEGDAARPVATLEIRRSASLVTLSVVVHDDAANRHLSREIDTRETAPDARALSLAQAADELVRASGADPTAARAPADVALPGPIAPDPPRSDPPSPPSQRIEVGAGLAGEIFTTGYAQLGPDAALTFFPWPRLGASVRGGLRSGGSADSAFGTVRTSSVLGSAAMVVRIVTRDRTGLDVGADFAVMRVAFEGEPATNVIGREGAAFAAYASAILRGWIVVAPPLRVSLAMSSGGPLRTVRAVGPGETVVSVNGVSVGGQLLLGAGW